MNGRPEIAWLAFGCLILFVLLVLIGAAWR
jgi:hypothetical protein